MTSRELFYNEVLLQSFGASCRLIEASPVSGGCINHAVALKSTCGHYFLKWNNQEMSDMFLKEMEGLKVLRSVNLVSIPKPYQTGIIDGKSYLLLEHIEGNNRSPQFWSDFAQRLASIHSNTAEQFGLDHHNYIGRLPQSNRWDINWIDFFIEQRLLTQLKLGQKNGYISSALMNKFEALFKKLSGLIPSETPALIHGDLWSGNYMTGSDGLVCLIDPAIYYGNREVEIAFTRLFGGFSEVFYDSYNEVQPLLPGFEDRTDLYNLYPLLVHVNLFGSSYLSGITTILSRFVT